MRELEADKPKVWIHSERFLTAGKTALPIVNPLAVGPAARVVKGLRWNDLDRM